MKNSFLLTLCLLLFAGCSLFSAGRLDIDDYQVVPEHDAQNILAALEKHRGEIQSARVFVHASVAKGVLREKAEQVVVFERPHNLRVEFFVPGINQLLLLIVANQSELLAYNREERSAYRGPADRAAINKLLSVPFVPEELMLWLSGRVNLPNSAEGRKVEIRKKISNKTQTDRFLLYADDGGERKTLSEFSCVAAGAERCAGIQLEAVEIYRRTRNKLIMSTKYTQWAQDETALHFPREIEFWIPENGVQSKLVIDEFTANPDLKKVGKKLFKFRIPRGVPVEEFAN